MEKRKVRTNIRIFFFLFVSHWEKFPSLLVSVRRRRRSELSQEEVYWMENFFLPAVPVWDIKVLDFPSLSILLTTSIPQAIIWRLGLSVVISEWCLQLQASFRCLLFLPAIRSTIKTIISDCLAAWLFLQSVGGDVLPPAALPCFYQLSRGISEPEKESTGGRSQHRADQGPDGPRSALWLLEAGRKVMTSHPTPAVVLNTVVCSARKPEIVFFFTSVFPA